MDFSQGMNNGKGVPPLNNKTTVVTIKTGRAKVNETPMTRKLSGTKTSSINKKKLETKKKPEPKKKPESKKKLDVKNENASSDIKANKKTANAKKETRKRKASPIKKKNGNPNGGMTLTIRDDDTGACLIYTDPNSNLDDVLM